MTAGTTVSLDGEDMDYTIKVGGAAGQGIQTIGNTLSSVMSRSGYHIFSHQDYESRVRGGHNFFQVRFSENRVLSSRETIDLLIALDAESLPLHGPELGRNGNAIYDSSSSGASTDDPRFVDVPFNELATGRGGYEVMANSVAMGAALGMLGMKPEVLLQVLGERLATKGDDVVHANRDAAVAGWEFASDNCPRCSIEVEPVGEKKMVLDGSQAVALSAIGSGCMFYAAYPMTPSTGVLNYMAQKSEEFGLVVEQAEDEISAINMALGASFAGVRAMTGTSGGGFSLMVEGVSLAGMTETPIVIVLAQRPGPATGLPTRTEQADLLFALHAGHGEVPRVVFAPGTPEQAFMLTNKAFDLTEKYQVPALILIDQHFADSQWTVDDIDPGSLVYNDYRLRGDRLESMDTYKRYLLTGDGVSPLAVPGASRHLVVVDSDEHDEEGHIIEDAPTRRKMVEKRFFKKMPRIRAEVGQPLFYGSEDPEVLVVGWGSTFGVLKESVDALSDDYSVAMFHFSEIYPFPADTQGFLDRFERSGRTVCIENNATGMFAGLMRAETGYEFDTKVNRYDGRPFTLDGLVKEIDDRIQGL